jgi:hypothetical protein
MACLRARERRASNWLVSKGMPTAGATALVWVVKLAALGAALRCLLVGTRDGGRRGGGMGCCCNTDGTSGLSPSSPSCARRPGYDPNLYNDTSHELYTDD